MEDNQQTPQEDGLYVTVSRKSVCHINILWGFQYRTVNAGQKATADQD
jgi:hypothetical protein